MNILRWFLVHDRFTESIVDLVWDPDNIRRLKGACFSFLGILNYHFVTCHAFAQGRSLRSLVTIHNKAFILYNAFDLRRKPRIIVLSVWLQEFKCRSCEFAWRDNGDEQLLDSMTIITQSIRSREKGCLHRIRIVHQQLNNRTWLIYMDIKHGEIFANRIM